MKMLVIPPPQKTTNFEQRPSIYMTGRNGKTVRYVFNCRADLENVHDSLEMVDGGVHQKMYDRHEGIDFAYGDFFFPDSIAAPDPDYENVMKPKYMMCIYTREDAWEEPNAPAEP